MVSFCMVVLTCLWQDAMKKLSKKASPDEKEAAVQNVNDAAAKLKAAREVRVTPSKD